MPSSAVAFESVCALGESSRTIGEYVPLQIAHFMGGPLDGKGRNKGEPKPMLVESTDKEITIPTDANMRFCHTYRRRCKGSRVFIYEGVQQVGGENAK